MKTPTEHCPCTCAAEYKRLGRKDPWCFSCQHGVELVEAVRAEFASEAAAALRKQANATGMGMGLIARDGLKQAAEIVEALARSNSSEAPNSSTEEYAARHPQHSYCCDLWNQGHRDGCPGKPQAPAACHHEQGPRTGLAGVVRCGECGAIL